MQTLFCGVSRCFGFYRLRRAAPGGVRGMGVILAVRGKRTKGQTGFIISSSLQSGRAARAAPGKLPIFPAAPPFLLFAAASSAARRVQQHQTGPAEAGAPPVRPGRCGGPAPKHPFPGQGTARISCSRTMLLGEREAISRNSRSGGIRVFPALRHQGGIGGGFPRGSVFSHPALNLTPGHGAAGRQDGAWGGGSGAQPQCCGHVAGPDPAPRGAPSRGQGRSHPKHGTLETPTSPRADREPGVPLPSEASALFSLTQGCPRGTGERPRGQNLLGRAPRCRDGRVGWSPSACF